MSYLACEGPTTEDRTVSRTYKSEHMLELTGSRASLISNERRNEQAFADKFAA
jgi:hypothetical protein